jgi:hypothetical protein
LLAEFNAVLKQFNVMADRGAEDTMMRMKGGWVYNLINENGDKIGIPIYTLRGIVKLFQKSLLAPESGGLVHQVSIKADLTFPW